MNGPKFLESKRDNLLGTDNNNNDNNKNLTRISIPMLSVHSNFEQEHKLYKGPNASARDITKRALLIYIGPEK